MAGPPLRAPAACGRCFTTGWESHAVQLLAWHPALVSLCINRSRKLGTSLQHSLFVWLTDTEVGAPAAQRAAVSRQPLSRPPPHQVWRAGDVQVADVQRDRGDGRRCCSRHHAARAQGPRPHWGVRHQLARVDDRHAGAQATLTLSSHIRSCRAYSGTEVIVQG